MRTLRRTATGMMLAALLYCISLTGCGRSLPETVPVHGTVTLDGKPLGVGRITFQPIKSAAGYPNRPASGKIGNDGSFEMSSFAPGDGVVPGEYQVVINTQTSGPTPENPTAPEVWAAPRRYGSSDKSGLKVTVEAGSSGPLEVQFDLEK